MTLHLTSPHTSDELESFDTELDPLTYALKPVECDGRYSSGDDVIVTSSDGDQFIAHVTDVDEDRLRLYVELD